MINSRQLAARWVLTHHGPDSEMVNDISNMNEIRILLLGSQDFTEDLVLRLAKLGHYVTPYPINITLAGPRAESRCVLVQTVDHYQVKGGK